MIAEFGLAWILPRLAGLGTALDMLLTGRLVDAAEARQIGLVSRVLPDEGFADAVSAWAKEFAAGVRPRSTRIIKRQSQDPDKACETAEREMHASLRCEDCKEGVAHFMEKRPPSFTGK